MSLVLYVRLCPYCYITILGMLVKENCFETNKNKQGRENSIRSRVPPGLPGSRMWMCKPLSRRILMLTKKRLNLK